MNTTWKMDCTRNEAGRLVSLSLRGVPADWTDYDVQLAMQNMLKSGTGVERIFASTVLETPCIDLSHSGSSGVRVFVDMS